MRDSFEGDMEEVRRAAYKFIDELFGRHIFDVGIKLVVVWMIIAAAWVMSFWMF